MLRLVVLFAALSVAAGAVVQYNTALENEVFPKRSEAELRRIAKIPSGVSLDPDVNRTLVEIVQAKGAWRSCVFRTCGRCLRKRSFLLQSPFRSSGF